MIERADERNEQTLLFYLPRATLRVVSGPLRGRQFTLHGAPMVIGRHDAPISLETRTVSRLHAQVRYLDGSYWIETRGGQSVTYHNNRPIRDRAPLAPGDRVRIAEHVLELRLDAADDNEEPPARLTPPPPPQPRLWRRLRRSRTIRISAALLLVLAAGGGVWSQSPRAPRFLVSRESEAPRSMAVVVAAAPPLIPPLLPEPEPPARSTARLHHHSRAHLARPAELSPLDRTALEALHDQALVEYRAARQERADALSDGAEATRLSAATNRLESAREQLQLLGRVIDSTAIKGAKP